MSEDATQDGRPRDGLPPELRAAIRRSWGRNEAAYRYLAGEPPRGACVAIAAVTALEASRKSDDGQWLVYAKTREGR